jgi:hypothetical protein
VRFGVAMFNHPHGLHIDRDGNVWAADDHGGGGKVTRCSSSARRARY